MLAGDRRRLSAALIYWETPGLCRGDTYSTPEIGADNLLSCFIFPAILTTLKP
jgi:hypothetical protein